LLQKILKLLFRLHVAKTSKGIDPRIFASQLEKFLIEKRFGKVDGKTKQPLLPQQQEEEIRQLRFRIKQATQTYLDYCARRHPTKINI